MNEHKKTHNEQNKTRADLECEKRKTRKEEQRKEKRQPLINRIHLF